MSELLTDEELAEALAHVRSDEDRYGLSAIEGHIDALTKQRDRARDMVVSLEDEHAERDRFNRKLLGYDRGAIYTPPPPPIEQRTLDALLGFAGGHAHANQQAIEGEA